MHRLKILATGSYLPPSVVTSEDIDRSLGWELGTAHTLSGVESRRYVFKEKACDMAAQAVEQALKRSGLAPQDIDLLMCASGTPQQPLPCNASLVAERLGPAWSGKPAFDVNSTCLGAVVALDMANSLIVSGRYQTIMVVASDIASCGLNPKQPEAYALFGDGAAAVLVSRDPDPEGVSKICGSVLHTYAEGAHLTEISAGGSAFPGYLYEPSVHDRYLFHMEGPKVYRLASMHVPSAVNELYQKSGVRREDIRWFVPHQASGAAVELLRRKLEFPKDRMVYTLPDCGNTIASSIPIALDWAVNEGGLQRGEHVMLFGTAAGFTVGGMILVY
jgi:3-oxoacyl-[acyl-carrier-protein] synthase-3